MTVVELDTVELDEIVVTDRIRRSVGDVSTLAASIKEVGQLQPLVVTRDMRLVAGERRLEALRLLGRKTAMVTLLDFDSVAKLATAERDENTERVPFTREEQIRAAMRIEEALKPAAQERLAEARRRGGMARHGITEPADASPDASAAGPTSHLAAAAAGISPATYQRGREVLRMHDDAPDDVKPELRAVIDEMNETGGVTTAQKKARELATAKGMPAPGTNKKKRTPGSVRHHKDWHHFDKAWGALTGACEHAVHMPIPDDATPERMESMLRELEGCITGINQLRKRLKETLTNE